MKRLTEFTSHCNMFTGRVYFTELPGPHEWVRALMQLAEARSQQSQFSSHGKDKAMFEH